MTKLILQIMMLMTWYLFVGVVDGELNHRTFMEISGVIETQVNVFHEAVLFAWIYSSLGYSRRLIGLCKDKMIIMNGPVSNQKQIPLHQKYAICLHKKSIILLPSALPSVDPNSISLVLSSSKLAHLAFLFIPQLTHAASRVGQRKNK